VLSLIQRAFAGETVHHPAIWYDARELKQVTVPDGRRVAISSTFFPIFGGDRRVTHVAIVFKDFTAEIAAREEAESERARADIERELYEAIVFHSGDGVIACDAKGNITVFNPEAERQHGFSARDVPAANWARTFGLQTLEGKPLPLESTPLYRALQGEKVENARWLVRRPDATLRTLVGTAATMRDRDGTIRGAVLVSRDETERLQLEAERQQAYAQLQETDARKDEFLATLAHELRNPLAPIRNAVQLLRLKGGSDPELHSARDMIDRQVRHMVRLIDDLMDASRITRGKVELKRERVVLKTVVEHALETVRPEVGHQLTVMLPPEQVTLHADPVRLAQVFANLLQNACKYTERGGSIRLAAELDGADVVVRVIDSGIGIAREELPRVFDMFTQVTSSPNRSQDGLGIGLALARSLVQMHGGDIQARSDGTGRGSQFIVRLPALPHAPAAVVAQHEPDAPSCPPRRVLVVDDVRDSAQSLAALLRLGGHEVDIAHDGIEAVSKAQSFAPDVILLDIGLPKLNGYEACSAIRSRVSEGAVRIFALTGWGQDEDRRRSREAGFDGHLVKPVELADVTRLLAHASPARERRSGRTGPRDDAD
jgi:PAS domain S-box-containing protein